MPFEILVLVFYILFAFGFMINVFVNGTEPALLRVFKGLSAFILGAVWFPIIFGMDIYRRLYK